MICRPCRNGVHKECSSVKRDKTWCDCQHKVEGKWVSVKANTKYNYKDGELTEETDGKS